MHNAAGRTAVRAAAVIAAALALRQYVYLPLHANHVYKIVTLRTEAALQSNETRADRLALQNLADLEPLAASSRTSVDFHLIYAANARILRRNQEAIEHYTAAIAANPRPEIYFERGITYLEEKQLEPATEDLALACRFDPAYLTGVDETMQQRINARNKAVPYNAPPR